MRRERATTSPAIDNLLQAGAAVDTPGPDGTTALHWATYRDDAEMVSRLLAAGADVNRTNRYDETPLSLACVNGNSGIVEDLLELGAYPNLHAAGEPPLLTCARSGSIETVKLLLRHGANPNVTDAWKGQTALMWAAAEDHVTVVETLVAHGADVNLASTAGETPLLFAVQLGHDDTMRTLLAAGHHTFGPMLLDHGADPNALDKQGQSALYAVVEARRLKHQSRRTIPGPESFTFLEHLIAAGADIDARIVATPAQNAFDRPDAPDDDEEPDDAAADEAKAQEEEKAKEEQKKEPTPDDAAVIFFDLDFFTDLVEATPFLLAARSADLDAMRFLLERGADPLTTTKGGNTALTLASGVVFIEGSFGEFEGPPKSDVLEAVQLLLELGADVNTGNSKEANRTARRRVSRSGRCDPIPRRGRGTDRREGHGRTDSTAPRRAGLQPVGQPDTPRALC